MTTPQRVLMVVALGLFAIGVGLAFLPVHAAIDGSPPFACNAAAVREANTAGADTTGLSTYDPAIWVWIHSSAVESADIGYGTGTDFAAACQGAAQTQMIWVLVLAFGAVLLLVVAAVLPRREPSS